MSLKEFKVKIENSRAEALGEVNTMVYRKSNNKYGKEDHDLVRETETVWEKQSKFRKQTCWKLSAKKLPVKN